MGIHTLKNVQRTKQNYLRKKQIATCAKQQRLLMQFFLTVVTQSGCATKRFSTLAVTPHYQARPQTLRRSETPRQSCSANVQQFKKKSSICRASSLSPAPNGLLISPQPCMQQAGILSTGTHIQSPAAHSRVSHNPGQLQGATAA